MKPEELDKATADEAWRILEEGQDVAVIAARLAREGYRPPPPVDPDVLAFREWMDTNPLKPRPATEQNRYDSLLCEVFVQGARMARKQAQERAKALEGLLREIEPYTNFIPWFDLRDRFDALLKEPTP